MQLAYYGDVISQNITKTPEGYLICKNVPIGRTGSMQYLGSELGLDGMDDKIIDVFREPEDVFVPAAIASFEGKPVTNGHPPQDIELSNWVSYAKGHVQNVRRGAGKDADKMVADLFITDPTLISEIENGKRQVSSGYGCRYRLNDNGTVNQMEIRGNHVAVVDEGRAGPAVSIKDSKPESETKVLERSKPLMGRTKTKQGRFDGILRLMAKSARDAKTVDELEEVVSDAAEAIESSMDEVGTNNATEVKSEAPAEAGAKPAQVEAKASDEGMGMGEVLAALAALTAKVEGLCAPAPTDQEAVAAEAATTDKEDVIEALVKELSGTETPTPDENAAAAEEALTVEPETMDNVALEGEAADEETPPMTDSVKDAAMAILKDARPAIAAIKDAAERKRVTDALVTSIRNQMTNPMGNILKNATQTAKAWAADSTFSTQAFDVDSRQSAYDKRNPHNTKKGE